MSTRDEIIEAVRRHTYATTEQVCREVGCSARHVRRVTAEVGGPVVQVGGRGRHRGLLTMRDNTAEMLERLQILNEVVHDGKGWT